MDIFYYLYAFLIFYILKFFRELRRTYKLSSYTTLYKSGVKDDTPFALGILYIILATLGAPIVATVSICMNFESLKEFIIDNLSSAGYYININTLDWLTIIFTNDSSVISITNSDLLNTISDRLSAFRIHSSVFIISALIVQAKIFDDRAVVVFEEGIMYNGTFYTWERIKAIDIVDKDKVTMDNILSRFSKKEFIHFEIAIDKSISRYDFFKAGNKTVPKEGLDNIYEKLKFKIPDANLLDFECAIRMVNVTSNLY